ncbi:MAG: CBS domain-containing protein [Gemmatimonadales bacterium]|nr:MAG: CBS domain-containing protein [Gemmatimonadales bacterium]
MKLGDALRPERIEVPLRATGPEGAWLALHARVGGEGEPEAVLDHAPSPRSRIRIVRSGVGVSAALGISPEPLAVPEDEHEEGESGTGPRVLLLVRVEPGRRGAEGLPERVGQVLARPEVESRLLTASCPEDVMGVTELLLAELVRPLRVGDAYTSLPYRIYPDTPLPEVVGLMARRALSAVPVVDRELQVLGVISAGDALKEAIQAGGGEPARMGHLTARDVMSRSVMCVTEEEELTDAARTMVHREMDQLPVVREGQVVGFLTRDAVLRALFGDEGSPST